MRVLLHNFCVSPEGDREKLLWYNDNIFLNEKTETKLLRLVRGPFIPKEVLELLQVMEDDPV